MKASTNGLPIRSFLFTLDQVSTMLEIGTKSLKDGYIHFHGRSVGPRPLDKILARNLAEPGEKPEWRVAEQEFIRWMRRKGFRVYQNDWTLQ